MLHIIRHSSKRHSLQIIALICMSSPRFGHYKKDIKHSNATEKDAHSRVEKQKDRPQRQASWPHVSVILDSHARCNELAAVNCSEHNLKITSYSCGCCFKNMSCSYRCSFKIMSYSYRCSFKIMSCSYRCSFKIMSYSYRCSFKIMSYSYRCSFKITRCSYRCSFKIMRCSCGLRLKTIWLAL